MRYNFVFVFDQPIVCQLQTLHMIVLRRVNRLLRHLRHIQLHLLRSRRRWDHRHAGQRPHRRVQCLRIGRDELEPLSIEPFELLRDHLVVASLHAQHQQRPQNFVHVLLVLHRKLPDVRHHLARPALLPVGPHREQRQLRPPALFGQRGVVVLHRGDRGPGDSPHQLAAVAHSRRLHRAAHLRNRHRRRARDLDHVDRLLQLHLLRARLHGLALLDLQLVQLLEETLHELGRRLDAAERRVAGLLPSLQRFVTTVVALDGKEAKESYVEPVAMRPVLFEGMVPLVARHQRHHQLAELLFVRFVPAVVQLEQKPLQRELFDRLQHRRRATTRAHRRVSTVVSDRGDRNAGLVRHVLDGLPPRVDFLDGPGELLGRPASLARLFFFGEIQHDGRGGDGGLPDLHRTIHEGGSGGGRDGAHRHVLVQIEVVARVVQRGALEVIRRVGDQIVRAQPLDLFQKLVDLPLFELLARDRARHLPRVLDVRVASEEPVEPVPVRTVFLERIGAIRGSQDPHHQLPHVLARNSHLLLLQLDDEVREDSLLVGRQHRRLPGLVASRLHDHRSERSVRVERRRVRPGHLRGKRLLLALLAVGDDGGLVVLLGENVVEHGAEVGVVDESARDFGGLAADHVVNGKILVLLEKELEGLEENGFVFGDRGTLRVAENLAKELKNIGLCDSEYNRTRLARVLIVVSFKGVKSVCKRTIFRRF